MGRAARARGRAMAGRPDIRLVNAAAAHFAAFITQNARHGFPVVQPNTASGQSLILCGAGPSLADTAGLDGDQVWACNGALPWMLSHGHRVTHGFTVNTLDAALWTPTPDLEYVVASSTHPDIVGRLPRATVFHNVCGPTFADCQAQDQLYADLYPPTLCAGSGLNAVTRALDVADYMGFAPITVLGADCCVRESQTHVAGNAPWTNLTMEATIDGRFWKAPTDLWISANWLVRMARASAGRIRLVGDTLPRALIDKPLTYLDRLPYMANEHGERIG